MIKTETLDVTSLEPRLKRPTVFEHFDALAAGESFKIFNDHDPKPLYWEIQAERGKDFTWEYIKSGPDTWLVQIGKKAATIAVATPGAPAPTVAGTATTANVDVVDVTKIVPQEKHPSLFRKFDSLKAGEAFILSNDHDPKPFYYQLIGERGADFSWTYLEQGPTTWRVMIKKNDADGGPTVGEIAVKDIRKAEIFKKKGIDFCCGGKKSLKEACEAAGVDVAEVEKELASLDAATTAYTATHKFDEWPLDFLYQYIITVHHTAVRESATIIENMATKVANHHGKNHPELPELAAKIKTFLDDMLAHMGKEETIVFPYIQELVKKKKDPQYTMQLPVSSSLKSPVQEMEEEHEDSGDELRYFRKITNDYALPADACNSYTFLYKKMQEFEEDLFQHIHLENNILFPKALQLEKEVLG